MRDREHLEQLPCVLIRYCQAQFVQGTLKLKTYNLNMKSIFTAAGHG